MASRLHRSFLVASLLLAALLVLTGCGGGGPEPTPTPTKTPMTDTAASVQEAAAATATAIPPTSTPVPPTATPLPPTATPIPVLQVGQRVQIANTDGEGIRFRSDASTASLTQEIYNDGALFTVLEPGGDYDSYPVEVEGLRWYRLQADDGLVGWTLYDFLAPVEAE